MAHPLQKASSRRKAIYLGVILALFTVSIFWRGKLDVPFAQPNSPTGWLNRQTVLNQATALDLRELDQGDPEVASSVFHVSLLGVRGMVVTAMWWAAIEKQKRNEFEEMELLVRGVTQLQPNFITPWIFQSWNIAYNVSVENDKLGDMYFYIARGIDLLAEGDRRNTKRYEGRMIGSPDIRFQIGFYYANKFGVSDKVQTLRSLAQVSCIPPGERKESVLTVVDPVTRERRVDPDAFRKFCEKNPQLVRRLRTKLKATHPQAVVDFLKDNEKIPDLYRNDFDLDAPELQFPALPPAFDPNEYYPGMPMDDTFDAFHAARAWHSYAQTVIPPPKREKDASGEETGEPLPWMSPRPGEYDPFKYRMPRAPAVIVFRQQPPRAQSYLAERMTKEGWFDDSTVWDPDEWAGTATAWFPRAGSGDVPPVQLRTRTGAREQWGRAFEMWDRYGRENALILSPERRQQLEDAAGLRGGAPPSLPPDRPDEELAKLGFTPRKAEAMRALVYHGQNLQVTNFPYFLEQSRAEADQLTVAARKTLWAADEARQNARNNLAVDLYVAGLAQWREVLVKFPQFHHTGRSDITEEETYEYEIKLIQLLKEDERVRARAERLAEAFMGLVPGGGHPVLTSQVRGDYVQAAAEDEAAARVTAESVEQIFPRRSFASTDPEARVVARVNQVAEATGVLGGAVAQAARPTVVRGVIDSEFAWMKEFKAHPGDRRDMWNLYPLEYYWVSPITRRSVKTRLGLIREIAPPADAGASQEGDAALATPVPVPDK